MLLLSVAVAGCGGASADGADGGGAADGGPLSVDDLIGRLPQVLCKVQVACGSMPDLATCLAANFPIASETDYLTLKADLETGKVHYDAAKGGACAHLLDRLAATYASGCKQSTPHDTGGDISCSEAFSGAVGDGDPCFTSMECASARCKKTDPGCSVTFQCCPGTCSPRQTIIPAGAPCSTTSTDQTCETGTICLTTASSTSPTCVAPSSVRGTACRTAYECKSPLFCDLTSAANGTCQTGAPTGAACNPSVSFGACDDNHDYCDKTAKVCVPLGAIGAACDPAQKNCLGYAQCLGSICVARPLERGACNATDGPSCLGNLRCSDQTKTCTFPEQAPACQ